MSWQRDREGHPRRSHLFPRLVALAAVVLLALLSLAPAANAQRPPRDIARADDVTFTDGSSLDGQAVSGPSGEDPEGSFVFTASVGGRLAFHVTCLRVTPAGPSAFIGGVVNRSSVPDVPVGTEAVIGFQDDGNRVGITEAQGDDCTTNPDPEDVFQLDVESGELTVIDAEGENDLAA